MPHQEPSPSPIAITRRRLLLWPALAALGALLQGCPAVFIAGAATTGVSVIHDRRSAGAVLDDQTIEVEAALALYNDANVRDNSSISVTSYDYLALLTGQANSAEVGQAAASIVARIGKVKRVVNEVATGPSATFTEETEASYITSDVKLSLFKVKVPTFDPTRVKVITEKNVVYLMGLVTREEADAVVAQVRYVNGVNKVVTVFDYLPSAK
jgi:osmotically-inducible protein OsmY